MATSYEKSTGTINQYFDALTAKPQKKRLTLAQSRKARIEKLRLFYENDTAQNGL